MTTASWGPHAPAIRRALAHAGDTHTPQDVLEIVAAGGAQVWAGERSIMVTVVEEEPRERRLLIWLAGGELRELVDRLRPQAEAWAKAIGCRRVLVMGRPGWERALAPEGYAPLARVIAKDLQR